MEIRAAMETEIDALATIWYDAWQDAHADILPPTLKKIRTRESFRERLSGALTSVRVAGNVNEPVALCIVKDDELYQLFVAAAARGTGVAAALLADAEQRMMERGVRTAWLACAIGNTRAARFYEKHGWQRRRRRESAGHTGRHLSARGLALRETAALSQESASPSTFPPRHVPFNDDVVGSEIVGIGVESVVVRLDGGGLIRNI